MPPSSILRVPVWLIYLLSLSTLTTGALPAFARVLVIVDKNTQQMSVSVDGVPRYRFAVSTGRAGYGTPNGTYHPQRLAASWFSKLYYNSPMPHSIFFHGGYAIHGSYEINRLGGPASHGCIRLHPANAAALFELVKSQGTAATSIVVSGSNPVIARSHVSSQGPHGRRWKPSRNDRYGPQGGSTVVHLAQNSRLHFHSQKNWFLARRLPPSGCLASSSEQNRRFPGLVISIRALFAPTRGDIL